MQHVWERGEMHTGLWWGDLTERGHLGGTGLEGSNNIEKELQEVGQRHGVD